MGNWRFGAFPKLPYSTMQQLNLDWILDRIRRFLPDTGTKGQVLTRTKDGAAWMDPEAISGAVSSVNGKTGAVVLTASDVGALPSSYQAPVTSVNGMTGDVIVSGGGAVDSVNGKTGEVVLTAADVGALPSSTVIPDSTSDLINDSGFITAAQAPVQSVNGKTGAAVLTATDVGALPDTLSHIVETGKSNSWSYYLLDDNTVIATRTIVTTLSNYTTFAGFSGYYIPNISTPFTMENVNYYVGLDWSIGAGFGLPAGRLAVTQTAFNAYALSTANGSVSVVLRMTLIGKKAV